MADYVIKLSITTSSEIEPHDLQGALNLPDVSKRLSEVVAAALTLPNVPSGKKYPKAGTFAVGSVTVEKK